MDVHVHVHISLSISENALPSVNMSLILERCHLGITGEQRSAVIHYVSVW